jgi:hypothetical protein
MSHDQPAHARSTDDNVSAIRLFSSSLDWRQVTADGQLTVFLVKIASIRIFASIAVARSTKATEKEEKKNTAENNTNNHQKFPMKQWRFS